MSEEIHNGMDYIDSRDIIERIKELREDSNNLSTNDLSDCEQDEMRLLQALVEEGKAATADWEFGVTLIHEYSFREYAQEFAEDIGAISREFQWPLHCIDWERAADELKMDYMEVDFGGATYYVR